MSNIFVNKEGIKKLYESTKSIFKRTNELISSWFFTSCTCVHMHFVEKVNGRRIESESFIFHGYFMGHFWSLWSHLEFYFSVLFYLYSIISIEFLTLLVIHWRDGHYTNVCIFYGIVESGLNAYCRIFFTGWPGHIENPTVLKFGLDPKGWKDSVFFLNSGNTECDDDRASLWMKCRGYMNTSLLFC